MRTFLFTRERLIAVSQIALFLLGLSGIELAGRQEGGLRAEELSGSEAPIEHRILPSEVRLSNLDAFEAQLRKDLPPGTAKTEVESYLGRSGLKHAYVSPHRAFSASIDNIGLRGPFQASLLILIYLGTSDQVKEVAFYVEYL